MNKNLEAYYDAWDKFIGAWIVIKIQDPSCVYQWRLQVIFILTIVSQKKQTNIACFICRLRLPCDSRDCPGCLMRRFVGLRLQWYLNDEVFYFWRFESFVLQVEDFVSRYLPAYKAYLPTLYSEGPNGSDPNRLLLIEIDDGRNPM